MNTRYVVKYRRRREGKTNYKKRIKLLLSKLPLVRFRKGSKTITAQISVFNPKGDKIILSVNSSELSKYGWNLSKKNLPAAYLTGLLLAKKNNKNKEIKRVIIDFGIKKPTKGFSGYSFVKGLIDGGMEVLCSQESFPAEDRIRGKHIADFCSSTKKKEQFSKTPESKNIEKIFLDVKNKIISFENWRK
ncbi:MAG: 50S ribosomal protein L18 [Candidatus Woesearchaeota archaeon]